MADQELLDQLSLRLIKGVGSLTFTRLIRAFGSAGEALRAPAAQVEALPGLGPALARALGARDFTADPEEQLAKLDRLGGRLVALADPLYPPCLRAIYAPPPLLFVLGDPRPLAGGGVAVVGSRNMTAYGAKVARELGAHLARAGISLVSGLARGVDGAAQQAALDGGGHTAGVLGCGLDVVYPPEHEDLMARVAARGAVISEFPLGTAPLAGHFPARNRVISGLARAVVVVEASLKSGSLITARHALDQGREVLAVPGPVSSATSRGCHELLKQGARLYGSPQDLLGPGALPFLQGAPPQPRPADLPAEAARLLELLGGEAAHIDELSRAAGLRSQEVSTLLLNLELAGLAQELPGKRFLKL